MTAKDFNLIAQVLANSGGDTPLARLHNDRLARDLADALADTNPRFNRERFLRAAGVAS